MENGRISSFQMGLMMYYAVISTAILYLPGITAKFARHDMWLSPILASLIGLITVYNAYRLHKLYPRQSIIEYTPKIVGTLAGKMLGFLFVFFYIQIAGTVVRDYAEFVVGVFLPHTPIEVVVGSMIFICSLAVRGGIEVIARAAQVFIWIYIISISALMLMLIPDMKVENLFPVLEHGIVPVIKGAVYPQAWYSEFLVISFFLPLVTDPSNALKASFFSVGGNVLTMFATNLLLLFVFGVETSNFAYPLISAAQNVRITDFFENVESAVMAIWVIGLFIKTSIFYYVSAVGTAQWLKLSDYRAMVLPVGVILWLFCFWSLPNQSAISQFNSTWVFSATTMQTIIPLSLLIIAVLRNTIGRSNRESASGQVR